MTETREDMTTMDRLGIEFLSVFGLPPAEFVHLAADLGCRHISTALFGAPVDPPLYPPFSLLDQDVRDAMVAAMRERDVSISLGEGLIIAPGVDVRSHDGALAVMAELGVRRINTISLDPDLGRSVEQFGVLAEMTAEAGMDLTVETSPGFVPHDVAMALEIVRQVDQPHFRLLIDTMHVSRTGTTPEDLAAIEPDLIGYIQLADVPLVADGSMSYFDEAMTNRLVPGAGGLPLVEILRALPTDVVVGIESPNLAQVRAVGVEPYMRQCVDSARELLERAHPGSSSPFATGRN